MNFIKTMKKDEPKIHKKTLKRFKKLIANSEKILILTHIRPDGDALGSTLALRKYLRNKNKKVYLVFQGRFDQSFRFLFSLEPVRFINKEKESQKQFLQDKVKEANLIIVCDACEDKRIGCFRNLKDKEKFRNKIIYIDHHTDKIKNPCKLAIVSRQYAATCQIIFDILEGNNVEITKETATCLLTGLFTDTGGFLHANTTSRVMEIGSFLMKQGASLSLIAKRTFSNKSVKTLKIWGRALKRVKLNQGNRMVYSYITQQDLEECGAKAEDLSGITNILGATKESIYSLLLAEVEKDRIKASLRSEEYKKFDVSNIARLFGGGGHPLASGFELKGKIKKDLNKTIVY